jgi:hypothetical protein
MFEANLAADLMTLRLTDVVTKLPPSLRDGGYYCPGYQYIQSAPEEPRTKVNWLVDAVRSVGAVRC